MGNSRGVVFSIVTPPGRGAVATIVVVGKSSSQIVNHHFESPSGRQIEPKYFGRVLYGNWNKDDRKGEDLVVCARSDLHIEIHSHGGSVATELIAKSLLDSGATQVSQKDIAETILDSKYLADFQAAIAKAKTWRSAEFMLDQQRAQADFLIDVVDLIDSEKEYEASMKLQSCFRWSQFGQKLTSPWNVVICGEPNAGKSSLINRMVGFERAIVHCEAGTTRDVVTQLTGIDGWLVRMIDTAGIRLSNDEIEQAGIDLARREIDAADLVLLIVDSSKTTPDEITKQIQDLRPNLIVANKCDLKTLDDRQVDISVSAKNNLGINEILRILIDKLVPEIPGPREFVPLSEFQNGLIEEIVCDIKNSKMDHVVNLLQSTISELQSSSV